MEQLLRTLLKHSIIHSVSYSGIITLLLQIDKSVRDIGFANEFNLEILTTPTTIKSELIKNELRKVNSSFNISDVEIALSAMCSLLGKEVIDIELLENLSLKLIFSDEVLIIPSRDEDWSYLFDTSWELSSVEINKQFISCDSGIELTTNIPLTSIAPN